MTANPMTPDAGLVAALRARVIRRGLQMISSPYMLETYEDWSDVRSPGRAKRRRAKHRQRIQIRHKPSAKVYFTPDGKMIAHPMVIDQIKKATDHER